MFYIDSSAIVALLTGEPSAKTAMAWLSDRTDARLLISDWTLTEVSSALSLKLRTRQLSTQEQDAARLEFQILIAKSFELLPIPRQCFQAAARYCERHDLGLRSGDALHLAIAMEAGAEIVTLDKRFASAAIALGGRSILL